MAETFVHRWERVGSIVPTELTEGRLQLHWASQIVASVGRALAKPEAGDSHTSMECIPVPRILAGDSLASSPNLRAALHVPELELRLMRGLSETDPVHSLIGKTLDEGLEWMTSAIRSATKEEHPALEKPSEYDMPSRSTGEGEPFSGEERQAFAELARWFANAECVLTEAASNYPSATAVRCWPHHFDIGFLVLLEPDEDPETAGSVGVGMSPGDSSYPQPYFYVNPYPRPEDPPEAELAGGGHWHSEGFFGAVLLGEKVTEDDSAEAQGSRERSFIQSALDALIVT